MPQRFAAVASVGGFLNVRDPCQFPNSTFRTPMMVIHGTADPDVKYDGISPSYPSAPGLVDFWATKHGCDPARSSTLVSMSPTTCTAPARSEEHTSELQSLMRISYAVFCLKKKKIQ